MAENQMWAAEGGLLFFFGVSHTIPCSLLLLFFLFLICLQWNSICFCRCWLGFRKEKGGFGYFLCLALGDRYAFKWISAFQLLCVSNGAEYKEDGMCGDGLSSLLSVFFFLSPGATVFDGQAIRSCAFHLWMTHSRWCPPSFYIPYAGIHQASLTVKCFVACSSVSHRSGACPLHDSWRLDYLRQIASTSG